MPTLIILILCDTVWLKEDVKDWNKWRLVHSKPTQGRNMVKEEVVKEEGDDRYYSGTS